MKIIPLTQGKVAIVDDDDYARICHYKWHAAKNRHVWYARRCENNKLVPMHRDILCYFGASPIDHRNGDGLDNRKENLRVSTHSLNQINRKHRTKSASRYRGVSYHKRDSVWFSGITKNGTYTYLGRFKDEISAAIAYNNAAKKLFGEDAQLNALKAGEPK